MLSHSSDPSPVPSTPSLGEQSEQAPGTAGLLKPDYRPRNRLDPYIFHRSSCIPKAAPELDYMSELWRYGIHRQERNEWRIGSLQRGLLWTLWLAALSVAAYSGYSLSHVNHNQIVVSPLRSVQSDARVLAVNEPRLPKKSANTEPDVLPLPKKNTTLDGTVEMANTAAVADPLVRLANDNVPVMAVLNGMGLAGELATPSVPLASPTALKKDSPEAADNPSVAEALQAKAQPLQRPFVAGRGVAVAKANLRIEPEFADSNCSEPLNAMQLCGSQASKADTYRQP